MKGKAYSYVRFSTRDQIHGDSLRRQTEAASRWCQQNGVELVDSYKDLGVSAFKGKNADKGALSAFLALVRKGRIEKGSYLVVESLDRVTRKDILDALELFLGIIRAGIVLVTLTDGQVYDASKITGGNFTPLVISLAVMSRAHEESATKAMRLAASWESKRKKLAKEKFTSKCVAWLKLSADKTKFEFVPERVAVVRKIFELARQGRGANGITKTLRSERVPAFGRSKAWHCSYVKKILDNRAVIGEFAPATKRGGKRTFFEPVADYYPAVVKKEMFATVQQLRRARPSFKGKSGFNVFSHLAFDKASGTPMTYVNKERSKGWHYLVSAAALRGEADYASWQYDEFLAVFLLVCQHASLQPAERSAVEDNKLDLARMELGDVEKQIERLVDFLAKGQSGSVAQKLRELESKKVSLQAKVRDLESETLARPADLSKVDWKDRTALRDNLRATVRRISVDIGQRHFHAQFLDGREYSLTVKDGFATIQMPHGETAVLGKMAPQ